MENTNSEDCIIKCLGKQQDYEVKFVQVREGNKILFQLYNFLDIIHFPMRLPLVWKQQQNSLMDKLSIQTSNII